MFTTILIFIITLLVLVVIHELGHFLMAKKFDIKVLEFGFGIPPRAWGRKVGETIISLNWLPFGGFVRLLGEDELPSEKSSEKSRHFSQKPVGQRMIVVVAGVLMNLFLAWILFYLVLSFQGFKAQFPLLVDYQFVGVNQQNESLVLIQDVAKNSPAQQAGLKSGERIIAINDEFIDDSKELVDKTKQLSGQEIKLTLSDPKKEQFRSVRLTPRINPPEGEGPLGVVLGQIKMANIQYSSSTQKVFSGPVHSWNLVAYSGVILGDLINQSFSKKSFEPVSQSVAGPVGITSVANAILTQTKNPILPYLDFVAILSLNLAVLNLFPFPALDGGRLFFLLIEATTKKRVHAEVERWVHTVGMAILLTLIVLVTFSDIRKLLF